MKSVYIWTPLVLHVFCFVPEYTGVQIKQVTNLSNIWDLNLMSVYVYSGCDLDRIDSAILIFICNLDIFIWSQQWYFQHKKNWHWKLLVSVTSNTLYVTNKNNNVRLAKILVIMSVSTFKIADILYLLKNIKETCSILVQSFKFFFTSFLCQH